VGAITAPAIAITLQIETDVQYDIFDEIEQKNPPAFAPRGLRMSCQHPFFKQQRDSLHPSKPM